MKFKSLIVIGVTLISGEFYAQQEPVFSQFWNAKTYYNPSVTGMYNKHQSTTIGRWQNVGVSGQPVSQLIGYALRLKKLHGGLGFTYFHEDISYNNTNKVKLNYSYHIKTKKEHTIAFGIGAGFHRMTYEGPFIPFVADDNILPGLESGINFTGDFGVVYSTGKMNIAVSGTQLTASRLGSYKEAPHIVLMTDYIFGLGERFQFKPQLFVMSDFVKTVFDVNGILYWKNRIGLGLSYRNTDELGFSLNWDFLNKFRLGYSFDYPMGAMSSISRGSHTGYFGINI